MKYECIGGPWDGFWETYVYHTSFYLFNPEHKKYLHAYTLKGRSNGPQAWIYHGMVHNDASFMSYKNISQCQEEPNP